MQGINNQPPNNISDFITLVRHVIWIEVAAHQK